MVTSNDHRCQSADRANPVGSGQTVGDMFVLHRAGRWFAGLLEAFDDALVALDDDADAPAAGY